MRENKEETEIKGWDFIELRGWYRKAGRKNRQKFRRAIKRGAKNQVREEIRRSMDLRS